MGILLFLALLLPQSNAASPSCFDIFVHPPIVAQPANDNQRRPEKEITSDFLNPEFQHTDKYTVEIQPKTAVKNQCATPLCHLHAWSADLENARNVSISQPYLNAAFLFYKTELALRKNLPSLQNTLGANPIDSMAAIRVLGLVPEAAWKGNKDFHQNPVSGRLIQALDAIVANFYERVRRLESDASRNQLYLQAFEQVSRLFGAVVGTELPAQFMYDNVLHTPQTFAKTYFPEIFQPVIKVEVPDKPVKNVAGKFDDNGLVIKATMDVLEQTARELLDSGRTVQLGYQHRGQFVDAERGVMSIDAFRYPGMAEPISREMRGDHRMWDGMHAILLVGYEVHPVTGQIIKWKVQNSWGETSGDKGFYHMYADYFRAYVFSIGYINDGRVPIPTYQSDKIISFPSAIDREESAE